MTIIAQMELDRYGVRCNAIAPSAMTRLIMTVPGAEDRPAVSVDEWDPRDPANISPFVAYLATADCPIKGRVFWVAGGDVGLFQPFAIVDSIHADHRWTLDELQTEAARFADFEFALNKPW
jgi:NAD(P)-dependent dehydrogenase (short-subunit alcohol dehydrogenase family)